MSSWLSSGLSEPLVQDKKAILFAVVEWPNSWHNCEIRLILTRSRKTECHQTIPLSPWLYGNLHFMSAFWLMAWFIQRIIYATWQGINHSTVHIHGFSAAVLPHSKPHYIYVMRCMSSNALKWWTYWKYVMKCGPNVFKYIKNILGVNQGKKHKSETWGQAAVLSKPFYANLKYLQHLVNATLPLVHLELNSDLYLK